MKYMREIIPIPIVSDACYSLKKRHDTQLAYYSKLLNEGYKDVSSHTMTVGKVGYMVFVIEKKLED